MRRRYTSGEYRALVDALRESRPDIAITTDLIVAFPGETDADFRDTLDLVRDVGFVDAFSFKFSPRPGTAAASMEDAVPGDVAQARLEELQTLQRARTLAAHRARVGETTEILVEGDSRRGGGQQSGRDPYHRVVNFDAPAGEPPQPGALLRVKIAEATPHSLIGECPAGETAGRIRRSVKDGSGLADENDRSALLGD
jgi:tRNA-2-methylthio-N6-dimethylallyladenosine synthase